MQRIDTRIIPVTVCLRGSETIIRVQAKSAVPGESRVFMMSTLRSLSPQNLFMSIFGDAGIVLTFFSQVETINVTGHGGP
jgi:hypothetical protein